MHILITGGAGFLGSHLTDALLNEGHSVLVVDNYITGRYRNLQHLERNPRLEIMAQDVSLPFDPGPFDFVYHMASPASPFDYLEHGVETLRVGSLGTMNVLELARKYGAGFLLASTSECYGDPHVHPQPETYWGHVNPIGPRSVYDESKRFAEAATMAWHRYHGVDTHIVRIFNTYGPRLQAHDGRVISTFIRQALAGEDLTIFGDGTQTRSFCFVSDEIDGIIRLSRSGEHMPVNVGNPNEFTMNECAATVLRLTGSHSNVIYQPLPQDDPKQRRPDIAKARELLSWSPKVQLEEGLMLTIDAMKKELSMETQRESALAAL